MRVTVVSPNGGTVVEIDHSELERYKSLGYKIKEAGQPPKKEKPEVADGDV